MGYLFGCAETLFEMVNYYYRITAFLLSAGTSQMCSLYQVRQVAERLAGYCNAKTCGNVNGIAVVLKQNRIGNPVSDTFYG